MDITEALRNEDLSKTDFFDFVTCPEMTETARLSRSPSFIDGLQDLKETNNNHLPSSADGFDHLLWGGNSGNVAPEKDSVKLETAIFEDWNKLWGHAVVTTDTATSSPALKTSNTDGAIYTLTVLNGEHPAWFSGKPDELQPQQPMDIESLLSIMAPAGSSSSSSFTFAEQDNSAGDPLLTDTNHNNYQNSLLRSALQGKATFRYSVKVEGEDEQLIVPSPDDQQDSSPASQTLFATTGVLPSMFEPPQSLQDSEPSAHSMDELLLSQLDVNYDYEKLRRIEDEVAESAQQFCETPPLYKLPVEQQQHSPQAKNKKYSKRSKSSASEKPASSTNNSSAAAARKERSLHYCTICSKGFKDKYSVNVHIRTHTGEKPFACNLCGKSFRQKAHLAKHYQTHAQKTSSSLSTSPNHKATKR